MAPHNRGDKHRKVSQGGEDAPWGRGSGAPCRPHTPQAACEEEHGANIAGDIHDRADRENRQKNIEKSAVSQDLIFQASGNGMYPMPTLYTKRIL